MTQRIHTGLAGHQKTAGDQEEIDLHPTERSYYNATAHMHNGLNVLTKTRFDGVPHRHAPCASKIEHGASPGPAGSMQKELRILKDLMLHLRAVVAVQLSVQKTTRLLTELLEHSLIQFATFCQLPGTNKRSDIHSYPLGSITELVTGEQSTNNASCRSASLKLAWRVVHQALVGEHNHPASGTSELCRTLPIPPTKSCRYRLSAGVELVYIASRR